MSYVEESFVQKLKYLLHFKRWCEQRLSRVSYLPSGSFIIDVVVNGKSDTDKCK